MDNTFDRLVDKYLTEQEHAVWKVGIFPGAFKPPHIGHYTTALNACNTCDSVYIFVSSKSRPLSTQNKSDGGKETCDSSRYGNLLGNDKYTNNLLGVQSAGCARMTSATAFRAAMAVKDKNTILKNLPDGVDKDLIFDVLMMSNEVDNEGYGHVTIEQAGAIWLEYKKLLARESNIDINDIHIRTSQISPVKDTYDLVSNLNEDERTAHKTSVYLYVGE